MDIKGSPYLKFTEPNQGCLFALRQIILDHDDDISESIKYSSACFSFKNKILCYLLVEKKSNSPYILFADGHYIEDDELEAGDRKRMKIFRVAADKDIPISKIKLLLSKAIKLHSK